MIKNYFDMANGSVLATSRDRFKSKEQLDKEKVDRLKQVYQLSHGKGKKSKKKKKKK